MIYITVAVPVSHHLTKYDTASESTVYIPRTSGGSHDESRKLSTIPSGSSFESSNTSGLQLIYVYCIILFSVIKVDLKTHVIITLSKYVHGC
jgi:hypothetical protein